MDSFRNRDPKCWSDIRRECPYLKQNHDAKRASIVVGMHNYLSTHAVEYLNEDLLVIGGSFLCDIGFWGYPIVFFGSFGYNGLGR